MGEYIFTLRINLGLSQRELAQKCGVCQQYISFVEHNQRLPSVTVLKKMAEILGVSIDKLVSGK